jgi:hypothetical protein
MPAYLAGDWQWFHRTGAFVAILGVFIGARDILRQGLRRMIYNLRHIDYGHIKPTPEELEAERQEELNVIARCWGIFLTLLGSIIALS